MKNPNRRWKYWRISKAKVESIDAAKRLAPAGYAYSDSQPGQFVFRKRLPDAVIESTAPDYEAAVE